MKLMLSTKERLILTILLLAYIPIFLMGIISSSLITSYQETKTAESIKSIVDIQSESLSSYFRSLSNVSKAIAKDEDVVKYVSAFSFGKNITFMDIIQSDKKIDMKSIMSSNNESVNSAIANSLKSKINNLKDSYGSIREIMLLNTDGEVINQLSIYNEEQSITFITRGDNHKSIADAIESDIENNNGFSMLNEYATEDTTTASFARSSIIMSDTTKVGYVVIVMDCKFFDSISQTKALDSNSTVYVCDSFGNVYNPIKKEAKLHTDYAEFKDIRSTFTDILMNKFQGPVKYKYSSDNMLLQAENISGTKGKEESSFWNIIASTNMTKLKASSSELQSGLKSTLFAMSIILGVIIVVFVMFFCRPVSNMLRVLDVNDVGGTSQRIAVNGKSELDYLASRMNIILDELSESESRYKTIIEMTDNIIFEINSKKNTVVFTDNFNKKFSYRANSLRYNDSFFVNGSVQREDKRAYDKFVTDMLSGKPAQGEFRLKTIYNDYAWYIIRSDAIRDVNDSIIKIVGVMLNIDRAKLRELSLMNKATLDPLTQVFNRESFEMSLSNEFELSQMRKKRDAVLFIDLDNFKHFNDNFGHAVGDEVLVYTADILKELVAGSGFVGRYGGDEFVVCFSEGESFDAGELAKDIIARLNRGFRSETAGMSITMNCSIGIAYFTNAEADPTSIIEDADEAMYAVKKSGKSNYSFYQKQRD